LRSRLKLVKALGVLNGEIEREPTELLEMLWLRKSRESSALRGLLMGEGEARRWTLRSAWKKERSGEMAKALSCLEVRGCLRLIISQATAALARAFPSEASICKLLSLEAVDCSVCSKYCGSAYQQSLLSICEGITVYLFGQYISKPEKAVLCLSEAYF